jgi:hypothetical protein
LAKTKYTPFLKLKANEVGAFANLADEVSDDLVPFFDLPMKKGLTEVAFRTMVDKSARKMEKYLGNDRTFFLDNFDIPDAITVGGKPNYSYVAAAFSELTFIPVIGLNRSPGHNQAVLDSKEEGLIDSSHVAVRLVGEDFDEFDLIEEELSELIGQALEVFEDCTLIIDCRVCLNVNPGAEANRIYEFLTAAEAKLPLAEIIVTGSSLPASIGQVAKTTQESELNRVELQIFDALRSFGGMDHVGLGDYTVVSPLYSDVTLPPEMLLNITAPKVLYAHGVVHYIARGGALKAHARGNLQYNDMLSDLTKMPFYRGEHYSFGDAFIAEKAQMGGSIVTPGSVLKPTINAHITYMATDHPFVA